jgi:hypothetical protein
MLGHDTAREMTRRKGIGTSVDRRISWLIPMAVLVSSALCGGPSCAGSCDLDRIRAAAAQSVPDYDVSAVRAEQGIVTLIFAARKGQGRFTVALHASETQLTTSLRADDLDSAELTRASRPISSWWQNTELQKALAVCSSGMKDNDPRSLDSALRNASQAALRGRYLGPNWVVVPFGGAWVVFAALLAWGELGWIYSTGPKRSLVALFGFSLLLHWWLSSQGPGDLSLNLGSIWWPSEWDVQWGPAPIALFRLLGLIVGRVRDTHILWCNLILSSLLPILVYGIVTELDVSHDAALIAAFLTTAHPFLIWFSGVLERQPIYLFAAWGSILALLGFLKRGGASAFVAFALGAALATLSRPEGGHVLVVLGAILLLAPGGARRRAVAAAMWAILGLLGYAYVHNVLQYGVLLRGDWPKSVTGPEAMLSTIIFSPDFTPAAWIVIWTVGLLLGMRLRAAWVAIAVLLGLHMAWTRTGLYTMFVGYARQVASARYESILLVPFAIGTALAAEVVLRLRGWLKLIVTAALVVATAVTVKRPYEDLLRPFTIDYEYRFLRREALALPSRSHLYILQSPIQDTGFLDARLVGQFVNSPVTFDVCGSPTDCGRVPRDGCDTYIYIGSSCAPLVQQANHPLGNDYEGWMRDCNAMRAQLAGSAVEEADVPARKIAWHDFRDLTVHLGLYRLSGSSTCPPPTDASTVATS